MIRRSFGGGLGSACERAWERTKAIVNTGIGVLDNLSVHSLRFLCKTRLNNLAWRFRLFGNLNQMFGNRITKQSRSDNVDILPPSLIVIPLHSASAIAGRQIRNGLLDAVVCLSSHKICLKGRPHYIVKSCWFVESKKREVALLG